MTLVQVGQLIINFDAVSHIRDLSTTDALGNAVPGPMVIEFGIGGCVQITEGTAALKGWINGVAKNVTATTAPTT